ncbi:MAG: energy-coupling factor transporter transmembrane protein EcfT [Coriobacteriales bacterium]|jgi:energy-coupling factor transport system permease protein|nr:energy-coupling factor transporter transmembrane protein EcfT [Coriobacteriales bacterium]
MTKEIFSENSEGGLRLDPRTKLLMLVVISVVLTTGGYGQMMTLARPLLAVMPIVLLACSRRYSAAVICSLTFALAYFAEIFLLQFVGGLLNFILLACVGILVRFMPCIVMAYFLVSTTTVSDFMAAMRKMHVSEKIAIPLSVMFRFFPTVRDEYAAIGDAMRMRGISFAGGKPLKMLEYRVVPMMMCSLKIGEELSCAALTRGLGAPIKRTNINNIGFHAQDYVSILLCAISIVAYVQWVLVS